MNQLGLSVLIRRYRIPVLLAAALATVLGLAWLWDRDEGGAPVSIPVPPPPPPPAAASAQPHGIVIVFDVSGSVRTGLGPRIDEALADVRAALNGILCTGTFAPERWSIRGRVPDLHTVDKDVTVLKVGTPNRQRPYFEAISLGKVDRSNCGGVGGAVPREFNHRQSYLELGKAEAVRLLGDKKLTPMYLIMVSDFVEGPDVRGPSEWSDAVNTYTTANTEGALFSASWAPNDRLKLRIIEVKPNA
jgi:hypothetical protein